MPCPWYSQGFCTSPKLDLASDTVTSPDRCLGDELRYKSCPYYVEPGSNTKSSNKKSSARLSTLRVYAPIHALIHEISIECPYAEILRTETGIRVVYCRALDRLLTRFEAELCAKHWRDCPYRLMASAVRT